MRRSQTCGTPSRSKRGHYAWVVSANGSTNAAFPIAFFFFFGAIWLVFGAMYIAGIAALVSIARQPTDAFGPWWDNTKQVWIIGTAVAFFIPFGPLIAGISWFSGGKAPLRRGAPPAGRPFWSGPPKPPPYPPYGYQPPGYPPPGYPPPDNPAAPAG
jgi:hypothetical protein